jgi:hypothetical protein
LFLSFPASTYSNYYDGWLLTESFSCSALIFSVWFFVNYFQSGKTKNLLFSGLLITWAIFLRPAFMPIVLVFLFVLIFQKQAKSLKGVLIFIIPFLLSEGAWVTHYYIRHQKLVLVNESMFIPRADTTYEKSLRIFIRSWGSSADFTDNNSALLWFGFHLKGMPTPKDYSGQLPDYIYTSKFNQDSLLLLKSKIVALNDSTLSAGKTALYQNELKEKLTAYTLSVKHEKPMLYYIEAPLFHCLPHFLFGPESKIYLKRFSLPGNVNFLSEGFFTLLYYMMVVIGIIGSFILLLKGFGKNKQLLIIATLPLYTIIVHACILRFTDNRYLMPAWAFLIVCASYCIVKVSFRLKP